MQASEWMKHLVEAVVQETGAPADSVTVEATAADIPGWDSLAHVRIMLNLEARAGETVDIDATYTAGSVGELTEILARQDG
ncbi:acyl carrier protein [Minwuia thermotolerans]|uniref:Acyl carrier protein n=1 Tax=Minwuia thermotolerans TaxID=2056226 RepID=A0A2M9G573_9PROT|nr:phosphopantetheine-binding protein [Minwuia thermotolerans]PJK30867.1 hypothetical protein CVT23_04460 [Minwuia thermotolerans]